MLAMMSGGEVQKECMGTLLSVQFFYKPNTALRIKVNKKKKIYLSSYIN